MPQRIHSRAIVLGAVLAASLTAGACRRTYVVVPRPAGGYTKVDTLYGQSDGRNVRVTFHFDTTWRVDTVTKLDTLWRGGTRVVVRVDTLREVRRDTVFLPAPRTPRPTEDPVRVAPPTSVPSPIPAGTPTGTPTTPRRDTVRIIVRDTIRVTIRDTIRVVQRDTIRRTDTVVVAGRRMLFVPPGQYPPPGSCRVWIHDLPPGQQARATPCNALGTIPAGAFILFGGEAWDADYDWVTEARRSAVPPEIIAVTRRRGRP